MAYGRKGSRGGVSLEEGAFFGETGASCGDSCRQGSALMGEPANKLRARKLCGANGGQDEG